MLHLNIWRKLYWKYYEVNISSLCVIISLIFRFLPLQVTVCTLSSPPQSLLCYSLTGRMHCFSLSGHHAVSTLVTTLCHLPLSGPSALVAYISVSTRSLQLVLPLCKFCLFGDLNIQEQKLHLSQECTIFFCHYSQTNSITLFCMYIALSISNLVMT